MGNPIREALGIFRDKICKIHVQYKPRNKEVDCYIRLQVTEPEDTP